MWILCKPSTGEYIRFEREDWADIAYFKAMANKNDPKHPVHIEWLD